MAIYRKIQFTNQIKHNLYHYLNYELLDKGYWRSIASGTSDNEGNYISKCVLDNTDSSYPSGSVWKAPRENWIHETNVIIPTGGSSINVPSGIWLQNIFYPKAHSVYGHVFDYINGRVIFTSGAKILPHKSVLVKYSFKEYSLRCLNSYEATRLNNDYFANDRVG
jgi:hypothetical protein